MAKEFTVKASELAQSVTVCVKVKGYQGWILRLKIGMCLVRLGCRIAGINVEFEKGSRDK